MSAATRSRFWCTLDLKCASIDEGGFVNYDWKLSSVFSQVKYSLHVVFAIRSDCREGFLLCLPRHLFRLE